MCSDRYAEDTPFLLPKTQLPPIRSDFSKQSNGIERSGSALAPAIPDEPAPITHARGSWTIEHQPSKKMTGASTWQAPMRRPDDPPPAARCPRPHGRRFERALAG